jgi:DNA-binding transcriptional LysR family regulator
MEIRQLKHFLAIVETGSFTNGAERAAISQPALSSSISKLEEELGVRLLDRCRAQIVPTVAGAKLVERANSLLLIYDALKSEVRDATGHRPLRIGVLNSLSSRPISQLLNRFHQSYPKVSFEIFDGSEAELTKRAIDKRLDVIISTAQEDSPARLESKALFAEQLMLALPHQHRLVNRKHVTLGDLSSESFIERSCCVGYKAAAKALAEHGVKTRVVYRTDQEDRALSLVATGMGVTLVPELFCHHMVCKRLLSDFEYRRIISVQWNTDVKHDFINEFVIAASSHAWLLYNKI